ncbi:hypothetical protein GYMLUDRAFT_595730 [Collybiopsis luxurians FD-317 M1]|uniref:Uncharacterized protein n=1 Tax=Collybiopsis luxurians FD-317 M1 TaxID=944289 RepID=A0A0D0CX71_9AGAR|nr:hypothetical protein GYMLUDRAFT_595730 [Collybiopsis luxurians FD-317 M1]
MRVPASSPLAICSASSVIAENGLPIVALVPKACESQSHSVLRSPLSLGSNLPVAQSFFLSMIPGDSVQQQRISGWVSHRCSPICYLTPPPNALSAEWARQSLTGHELCPAHSIRL